MSMQFQSVEGGHQVNMARKITWPRDDRVPKIVSDPMLHLADPNFKVSRVLVEPIHIGKDIKKTKPIQGRRTTVILLAVVFQHS